VRLWQFTLPTHTNNRLSYEFARKQWAAEAVKLAGGVTVPQTFCDGVWRGDNGDEFRDQVALYTVAADADVADKLLAAAFRLFPDQEAFLRVDLGEASIIPRPARIEPAAA
jgi:hypothetical protein